MNANVPVSEKLALVGQVQPASQAVGTFQTQAINTALHRRVWFEITTGALGAGATVDFKVQAAATAGGVYADVPGGITSIATIAVSGDLAECEVRAETLQTLGVGPFIKGTLVVGVAASVAAVNAWGAAERYFPASDHNLANVSSIVSV